MSCPMRVKSREPVIEAGDALRVFLQHEFRYSADRHRLLRRGRRARCERRRFWAEEIFSKAVRVQKLGGRELLEYIDVPEPRPERGEVLVAVEFAGVNYFDVYQREGLYRIAMPYVPGTEAAGRGLAVGPGGSGLRRGAA